MEPVRFATEDGLSLEGELRMPEPEGKPLGTAVICHAHPRHGGSKDHPLLWAVRNELAHRGFAVLAFNFRGTMRSDGTYAGGRTEVKDVAAAVGRVREESEGPTVLCGWSFGANVALREALDDDRVAALALIGLAMEHDLDIPSNPGPSELAVFRRPVLLLAGENDEYAPEDGLRRFGEAFTRAEVVMIEGTDHYLWRREKDAATAVGDFAARLLD